MSQPKDLYGAVREMVKEVGYEKLGVMVLHSLASNDAHFVEASQSCAADRPRLEALAGGFTEFINGIRNDDAFTDITFDKMFAAMVLMITGVVTHESAIQLVAYLLTRQAWERQPAADTADTAARKAKAAKEVVDQFIDLAQETFNATESKD